MKRKYNKQLLTAVGAVAGVALGAGMAMAAHKPINLFTYEELAAQFGMQKMPVFVDAQGKGMPYSPKQSCGTPGMFADGTVSACHDYNNIADHAFHSNQGVSEIKDTATGKFSQTKNKPWTQSPGMIGKW
jgi:hypothetical protein